MKVYYFGCVERAGHYMHTPDMRTDSSFMHENPWGFSIDGGLLPKREVQHEPVLAHKDGWTALSFWDRTVDSRPRSNSSFLAEGTHTMDEMFAIAHQYFPKIALRTSLPTPASATKEERK